jgi:hypothetical protein
MTETEFANLALALLGETTITDIAGTDPAAKACSRVLATVRDVELAKCRWNFALKRATLVESVATVPERWETAWVKPSDCLRVLALDEVEDLTNDWDVEGALIYWAGEDTPAPECLYIAKITDPTLWPAEFVEAMAHRLAERITPILRGSSDMRQQLRQDADRLFSIARRINGNTGRRGMRPLQEQF